MVISNIPSLSFFYCYFGNNAIPLSSASQTFWFFINKLSWRPHLSRSSANSKLSHPSIKMEISSGVYCLFFTVTMCLKTGFCIEYGSGVNFLGSLQLIISFVQNSRKIFKVHSSTDESYGNINPKGWDPGMVLLKIWKNQ